MTTDLDHRRALFTAALGFALLDTRGKPALPGGELGGSSILSALGLLR